MNTTGRFILGAIVGLFGLLGLFLAAGAEGDSAFYQAGLLLAAFAYLFILFLVKRSYDEAERRH